MISTPLTALLPVLDDLSRDLPQAERYQRLLQTLRGYLPCDALALLRLEGEQLVPVAVLGLRADTLGRRLRLDRHPRLQHILSRRHATRFPTDCDLPDPYDGLVIGADGPLQVHECLGCPLYINDQPWGVLTLDVLDPARFGRINLGRLEAFSHLAAATVKASERMQRLTLTAEQERLRADTWRQAAYHTPTAHLIGGSDAHHHLLNEIAQLISCALLRARAGDGTPGQSLQLTAADLGLASEQPSAAALPGTGDLLPVIGLRGAVDNYQRQLIGGLLQHHQGNLSATARALQIDRGNLHRLARRLGLIPPPQTPVQGRA